MNIEKSLSTIVTATTPTGSVITAAPSGTSIYLDESVLDKNDTPQETFSCLICGETHQDRAALNQHMSSHSDDEDDMYRCSTCGDQFKQLVDMMEHSKTHSRSRVYKCCGKSFNKFVDLKLHMKQHSRTGNVPAATVVNGDEVTQEAPITLNTSITTPVNNVPSTPTTLASPPKRYPCAICNKSFAYDRNLKSHLRIHTGQRLLTCESCDKQFVSPSDLRRHTLIHFKPYACKTCGRRYAQQAKVRDHIVKAHEGIGEHEIIISAASALSTTGSSINTTAITTTPKADTRVLLSTEQQQKTEILTTRIAVPLTVGGYKGHYIKKPEGLVPTTDTAVSLVKSETPSITVSSTDANDTTQSLKNFGQVILQPVNQLGLQSVGITYPGNDKYIVVQSGNLKDLTVMTTSTGQQFLSTTNRQPEVLSAETQQLQQLQDDQQQSLASVQKVMFERDNNTPLSTEEFGASVMDQAVTTDYSITTDTNPTLLADWQRSYAAGTAMLDLSQQDLIEQGDTDGQLLTPAWQTTHEEIQEVVATTTPTPPTSSLTTAVLQQQALLNVTRASKNNIISPPTSQIITTTTINNKTTPSKNKSSMPTKLKPHMAAANSSPKERPHACKTCGARFAQKAYLDNHLRTHTGEKPYKCEICGKKYGHNGTLYRHRKKHDNGKNISCTKCNTPFANKKDLEEHKCPKVTEKKYKCATCGESFMFVGSLKAHMRTHITAAPQITNQIAANQITSPQQIVNHLASQHDRKTIMQPVTVKGVKYAANTLNATNVVTMVPVTNSTIIPTNSTFSLQAGQDILHTTDSTTDIVNEMTEFRGQGTTSDFSDSANLIDYAMSFSELDLANAVEKVACDLYSTEDEPEISLSPTRHHAMQPYRMQQQQATLNPLVAEMQTVVALQQQPSTAMLTVQTGPQQTKRIPVSSLVSAGGQLTSGQLTGQC